MKNIIYGLMLICATLFLTNCDGGGGASAPSSVSGKTMTIQGTSAGTLTIVFKSNTSATISNSSGSKRFSSIKYSKTGINSAKLVINDIYVDFGSLGQAYDTENLSLVFSTPNQGIASGTWTRRPISGEVGSRNGTIDYEKFTLF